MSSVLLSHPSTFISGENAHIHNNLKEQSIADANELVDKFDDTLVTCDVARGIPDPDALWKAIISIVSAFRSGRNFPDGIRPDQSPIEHRNVGV